MIYSMTGYAARTLDLECGALQIELKSVNSRYLDIQFRVCEELRVAEPALREMFGARLARGKLECRMGFSASSARAQATVLNADLLQRLKAFEAQVRGELPDAAPLSVSDVLRWPGMFGDDSLDSATLVPAALALAKEALDDFTASRAREGVKVVLRIARLRMPFGVGGDGDLEVVAGFAADEFDEFVGVAEFAGLGHARGQVAAQGDEAADAGGAVVGKDVADVLPRRADAGEVRRGVEAFGGDVLDDGEGALTRRAAGTEGH